VAAEGMEFEGSAVGRVGQETVKSRKIMYYIDALSHYYPI
jgi:hypothetical protein